MTAMAESVSYEHPTPNVRRRSDEDDPLDGALLEPPPGLPLDPLTELLMLAKDVPWRRPPPSNTP